MEQLAYVILHNFIALPSIVQTKSPVYFFLPDMDPDSDSMNPDTDADSINPDMDPDPAFQVNPNPDPMHKGCPNYRGSPPVYGPRSQIRIRIRIENSVTDPDCKTVCGYQSRDPTEGITY